MLKYIDAFINRIMMYKLVLYGLLAVVIFSLALTFFGFMPFDVVDFILSLSVLVIVCQGLNKIISTIAKIHVNKDSTYITALILFLLFLPTKAPMDLLNLALVGVFAVLSKYLFVIGRSHIFNPAAIAATLGSVLLGLPAFWWVGSSYLIPLVTVVGFLIVRKTRKEMFAAIVIAIGALTALINFGSYASSISAFAIEIFVSWPLIFFATVMVTEPLTMPYTKKYQYGYAILVGLLFGSQYKFGPVFSTPENALLIANLLFLVVNARFKNKFNFLFNGK